MKTATLPPLRVTPQLRKAVEQCLGPGETLSTFVEQAIRQTVERRRADSTFAQQALKARAAYLKSGVYHAADDVMQELRTQLKSARRRKAR